MSFSPSSQSLTTSLARYARSQASYDSPTHLAFGGMAEIFLAWQRGANGFRRQVVLKRILPQFAQDKTFLDMFLNEARIVLQLSHRNIVRCYDLLEVPDGPVLVMEYVQGATLREVMGALRRRGERLPYGVAVRIVSAICAALEHAFHDPGPDLLPRRIIHRDVAPNNVLLSMDGAIKLSDFGIAKAVQSDDDARTAILKGTCAYMAPEQVQGEPMSHRTDVFSVGVLLYELTTGKRVFRRDTEMATMQAILHGEVPPPESAVPDYPPALKAIVERAMAQAPDDRYQQASELQRELEACAEAEGWGAERGGLEALMHELFPERAAIAEPTPAPPPVTNKATERITSIVSLPDTHSTSHSRQPTSSRIGHWELLALLACVASALFWVLAAL